MIPLGVLQQQQQGGSALRNLMISYWSLDEASGTRVDSHGSNDLPAFNGVGARTGKINDGVDFPNGSGDELKLAAASELKGGEKDFSIVGWAIFDLSFIPHYVVSHHDQAATNNGDYYLIATGTQFQWFVGSGAGSPGGFESLITTGTFNTGTWYFVVCSFNATSRKMKISVDDGTPFEYTTIYTRKDFGGSFQMGRKQAGSNGDNGNDEWIFYDRDLHDTPDDIAALYNSGAGVSYADTA